MNLSKTMQSAIDEMRAHGALEYHVGGWWARPGWSPTMAADNPGIPTFARVTIRALLDRGLIEVSTEGARYWRRATIKETSNVAA